jgi:DNA-binding transcriptional regulator YiaG
MPNIGTVLREEITRLSRRSTKALFMPLKKDVAGLKHIVLEQRRTIEQLGRANARLIADLNSRISKLPEVSAQDAEHVRISPRLIKAQRGRLGLSQEQFGRLLGVSAHAVFLWEHAKATPRAKVKGSFAAVRQLGKREARQRLDAMAATSGNGRNAA